MPIPIAIYASTPWDKYTLSPAWNQWMRCRPEMVIGWAPAQNPNLGTYPKVLAYVDAYAIYNTGKATDPALTNPEWILHDDKGNKLYIPWGCANGTCPQYAGDLTNPSFVKHQMDIISTLVQTGYQGIFLDDVNLALDTGDGTGAIVAPNGVTPEGWAFSFVHFLEEIRYSFPKLTIIHNAVWWSDAPQEAVNRQIVASTYYNIERGYGDGNLTPLRLSHQVQFVDHVHSFGRNVIQMEYSQNPIAPDTKTLDDKIAWFKTGYKPGDLMIVQDLFPDSWNAIMDTTNATN